MLGTIYSSLIYRKYKKACCWKLRFRLALVFASEVQGSRGEVSVELS
jgi:hypothetical protein